MFEEKPITDLNGVGPKLAKTLEKLNILTLGDLLFHLPLRYQDRTRLASIASIQEGDSVVVEGLVVKKELLQGKRRSLNIWLNDGTGLIVLRFFHFNQSMSASFMEEKRVRAFGEVRRGFNRLEMIHPESRPLDSAIPMTQTLTPIYPLTAGITQRQLRALIDQVIKKLDQTTFPSLIKKNTDNLWEGLIYLHTPPPDADLMLLSDKQHPWQQALALEEIVAYQLTLKKARTHTQASLAQAINLNSPAKSRLLTALPFRLTQAQNRVIGEIETDIQKTQPMMRLVQGDVGSGKTIVAAVALMHAATSVANGTKPRSQAILIAPTELLAEQHFLTISRWFTPLGITTGFLSGTLTAKQKNATLKAIEHGEITVIIGTHAVFQDAVHYQNLTLIVIDEQHRFGVAQRLTLQNKAQSTKPHQLMMTATPIPRTLAMIAYADLDHSIIDERPPNRIPVTTTLIHENKRNSVIARLNSQCQAGTQAYWVCTLIEESETLSAKAAQATFDELKILLPTLRVALLHGKMKARDKETIMNAYKAHELDLLIATTVIEVGVDVPNASIMIIENAERLGLFQLHQLRGRVGRGHAASHCILLYSPPLSEIGKERLKILKHTEDGFKIAEKDLLLRGAGEIIGTKQTGLITFKIADLGRHQMLVAPANRIAQKIINDDETINKLATRWLGHKNLFISV